MLDSCEWQSRFSSLDMECSHTERNLNQGFQPRNKHFFKLIDKYQESCIGSKSGILDQHLNIVANYTYFICSDGIFCWCTLCFAGLQIEAGAVPFAGDAVFADEAL